MKRLRQASIALVLVLMTAEVLARVKMSYNTGDTRYLADPFLGRKTVSAPQTSPETSREEAYVRLGGYYKMRPGVHPAPATGNYDTFRINRLGFRGPDLDPKIK